MFKTGAQMLLLTALVGLFFVRESRLWPAAQADAAFSDWLSLNAGELAKLPIAPVTLVAIDDASVAEHHLPWTPIDYSLFARAVTSLAPEVTAIQESLEWNETKLESSERLKMPQYERILGDTLLRCPKLLLGARLGWPEDPQALPVVEEVPLLRRVTGDLRQIPEYTVIEREPKEEFRLAGKLGFTNLTPTAHPLNSVPLVLRYRGEVVPTFVLQAAVLWRRLSLDDVEVELGSAITVGSNLRIPIDASGEMRIDFGAPRTVISFDDLLLSVEQLAAKRKTTAPIERFKGGVALLARTDRGSRTLPLSLGRTGSEGDLTVAAIATIQGGTFLQPPPVWTDFVLVGATAVIAWWIPRWRKSRVTVGAFLALLVYALSAIGLFATTRICLPLVLPTGLALFVGLYRWATPNPVNADGTPWP